MSSMQRKVILDCDPGIDDAVALCLGLAAEEFDVLAVTGVEGCVSADQANRNVQYLLSQLDPAKWPRIGSASHADEAPAVDTRYLHGDDGLGNVGSNTAAQHHPHPSEKLIGDLVRANPNQVTIIALGPTTNIARAFRRDPGLEGLVDRLIVMGGAVDGVGNITANAEFNVHFDPGSARHVLASRTTKTLIPLDVTRQVQWTLDLLEQLPDVGSRLGRLLRRMLPFAYRSYRQRLGQECILLNDAVALMAALEPDLFSTEGMAGDVEVSGELARGMVLFDRRHPQEWRANMEVAREVDVDRLRERFVTRLRRAAVFFRD